MVMRLENCIEVRHWMLTHRLKINDSKTELILFGTPQQLQKVNCCVKVGQSLISPSPVVRNLGVLFDQHLDLSDHVDSICKRGYGQLRRIGQIRNYIDQNAVESIVHSFCYQQQRLL